MSNGWILSTFAPCSVKYFKSRARVAGLQLTYIIFDFACNNVSSNTSCVQPFLGGSKIITSNFFFIDFKYFKVSCAKSSTFLILLSSKTSFAFSIDAEFSSTLVTFPETSETQIPNVAIPA